MIQAAWYSDVPFGTRFTILRFASSSAVTQIKAYVGDMHITQNVHQHRPPIFNC